MRVIRIVFWLLKRCMSLLFLGLSVAFVLFTVLSFTVGHVTWGMDLHDRPSDISTRQPIGNLTVTFSGWTLKGALHLDERNLHRPIPQLVHSGRLPGVLSWQKYLGTGTCWWRVEANPLLLWAILFGSALIWMVPRVRRWWRARHGCCLHCGYCLTGNVSGCCPECGAGVGQSGDSRGPAPSSSS